MLRCNVFFSKIGIFTSGSQVCVDDLENSRQLSLDMNEYPGTQIIFAFRDIKLIWNKKNSIYIVYWLRKCATYFPFRSLKNTKSPLNPSSLVTQKKPRVVRYHFTPCWYYFERWPPCRAYISCLCLIYLNDQPNLHIFVKINKAQNVSTTINNKKKFYLKSIHVITYIKTQALQSFSNRLNYRNICSVFH
jgi:hypothetical protein